MKQPIFEHIAGNEFKVNSESSNPSLTGIDEQDLEEQIESLYESCKRLYFASVKSQNKDAVNKTHVYLKKLTDAVDKMTKNLGSLTISTSTNPPEV